MRDTVGAAVSHTILETGANSACRFIMHLRVTNHVKFQPSTHRWQSASKMGVGYHSVQPIAPPPRGWPLVPGGPLSKRSAITPAAAPSAQEVWSYFLRHDNFRGHAARDTKSVLAQLPFVREQVRGQPNFCLL